MRTSVRFRTGPPINSKYIMKGMYKMPGTYAEAKAVATGHFPENMPADRISDKEPKGCSRTVYKIRDLVYKQDATFYDTSDNQREYDVLTYFRDEPWSSPVSLFNVDGTLILCMPYYPFREEKDGEILWPIADQICEWGYQAGYPSMVADLHNGNYRVDAFGQVKVIDAAGACCYYNGQRTV